MRDRVVALGIQYDFLLSGRPFFICSMRWFEDPRNFREMSFSDSTNGPSTSTSVRERNSSVTYVRQ